MSTPPPNKQANTSPNISLNKTSNTLSNASSDMSQIFERVKNKSYAVKMLLLEFLIIKILTLSRSSLYGKQIIERLKTRNVTASEGTIYPILSRMRKAKLLEYVFEETDIGSARKHYYVTECGRRYFIGIQKFLRQVAG